MKNERNNNIKWLGINLTKKRVYYLLVLDMIGFFIFFSLMYNAIYVFLNAATIYDFNRSIYFNILLLSLSNFIISFIFITILGKMSKKIRLFRKSLKVQ